MRYNAGFDNNVAGKQATVEELLRVHTTILPNVHMSPKTPHRPLGVIHRTQPELLNVSQSAQPAPLAPQRCPTLFQRRSNGLQSSAGLTLGQVLGALAKKRVEKTSGARAPQRQVISAPNLECETPRDDALHLPVTPRRVRQPRLPDHTRTAWPLIARTQHAQQARKPTTKRDTSKQMMQSLQKQWDELELSGCYSLASVKSMLDCRKTSLQRRVHAWLSNCAEHYGQWELGPEEPVRMPDETDDSSSVSGAQS